MTARRPAQRHAVAPEWPRNFPGRHVTQGSGHRGEDADAIFAIQPRAVDAAAYFDSIKGRVSNFGRDPDDCRILFGIQPIIGTTPAQACEKQDEHNALVPTEAGMAILSAHLDFDLARLPPDAIMAQRTEPELQRFRTRFFRTDGTPMTVAEVATRHGQSVGIAQLVGTPAGIADQMESFMEEVGGDGFMISAIHTPGAIEEFVDLVVPELQRRGLFRTEYKGRTQREILRQAD